MVVIHLYVNLKCVKVGESCDNPVRGEGERCETYTENNPALWDFVPPISPAVYG
jgi:hypothetical protein